jgi:hypothetical protein
LRNTCLITVKNEPLKRPNNQNTYTLYIEDYLSIASNSEARKLTDKIYTDNEEFIQSYDFDGYKVTWSWYGDIFQFCIHYLEVVDLIRKIDALNIKSLSIDKIHPKYKKVLELYFYEKKITITKPKKEFLPFIKDIIFNSLMLLYSLISILFLSLDKKKKVGTYTGDFVFKNTKSDFRLNHLYSKYKENNINYVEFIRPTNFKFFFVNVVKRKRFSIYYTSIIYFVNLITKKSRYLKKPLDFNQSILFNFHHSNIVLIRSIPFIQKILKILNINNFVLISFSSRSAHISFAAKSLHIKTIGIMHGLSQRDYVVQEFMESYNGSKKIGCDIYGVWSDYYYKYFHKHSKVMSLEAIQYSGLLRPMKNFISPLSFERLSSDKIKVLFISEPLISVAEVIPYLKRLLEHRDIELAFKVRPMIKDKYYEEMLVQFPEIKNLKTYDEKIENIGLDFDVFVGTHSTAVIEASLLGKVSILLDSIKFGDYFDINNLIEGESLLVRDPNKFYENILYRLNNENLIDSIGITRKLFFGDNKDGAQWVVEQIK